jgi:hypothetical protein
MLKKLSTMFLAGLLITGTLAELKPALARKGADDFLGLENDQRRGRGRGQDDFQEMQQLQRGRRGRGYVPDDRGRGRDDDVNQLLLDDIGRGGGRSRGRSGGY